MLYARQIRFMQIHIRGASKIHLTIMRFVESTHNLMVPNGQTTIHRIVCALWASQGHDGELCECVCKCSLGADADIECSSQDQGHLCLFGMNTKQRSMRRRAQW